MSQCARPLPCTVCLQVLLLHYSDMKRDHEGSIRKIADFLGYKPTKEQWRKVLELTRIES